MKERPDVYIQRGYESMRDGTKRDKGEGEREEERRRKAPNERRPLRVELC